MNTSLRNPVQKAATPRQRILDCAIELFAARGFEAMTMRMLGDAVGLDNSSLYRHFSSKSQILNAVLDQVAGEFLMEIERHLELSRPATLDALEAVAASAGTYFFDRQAAARLMVHWVMSMSTGESGVSIPATDTSRPGGKLLERLREWLEAGMRRGTLRKQAMPESVVILFGAILLRPATYGHLLASIEPKRSRIAACNIWEAELRSAVRGMFAP